MEARKAGFTEAADRLQGDSEQRWSWAQGTERMACAGDGFHKKEHFLMTNGWVLDGNEVIFQEGKKYFPCKQFFG